MFWDGCCLVSQKLTFKGGTALSKVYFPRTWRLSEDLDFSYPGSFDHLVAQLDSVFERVEGKSGIVLRLRSRHENPGYLQLKIQYAAVLGKNWIKLDINREEPIDRVVRKHLSRDFSDYQEFKIRVASLEDILAEKLRALIERKKCRDYFDVWKLMDLNVATEKVKAIFVSKCNTKGIEFNSLSQIFPRDLKEILQPYWIREMGRLVKPIPYMETVLKDLREKLGFLQERP